LPDELYVLFWFVLFSVWESITRLANDEKSGGGYWSLSRMVTVVPHGLFPLAQFGRESSPCSTVCPTAVIKQKAEFAQRQMYGGLARGKL